jgi:hypothetical protein
MAEEKRDITRTPRTSDTRTEEMREQSYDPSEMLPKPNARDGIDYRYVRVTARGIIDNINYSQALRGGWAPVKASDVPEFGAVLSDRDSPFPEGVLIGGLLLCQRDSAIGVRMQANIAKEIRNQIESLDGNYMRDDHDPKLPKFSDNRSSIRFGE